MAKKQERQYRKCSDCIHEWACQTWAHGTIHNADATNCAMYETVKDSTAYWLGFREGQNEAWELARKILFEEKQGGMEDEKYKAIFGSGNPSAYVIKNHTYSEAAAKVKAWEKAKKEIKDDEDCLKCQFFEKHNDEYPCSHCCHCYTSKFKQIGGEE